MLKLLLFFCASFFCCCLHNFWLGWRWFTFNCFLNYCNWFGILHSLMLLFSRFWFGSHSFDITVKLSLRWTDTSSKIYCNLVLKMLGLWWTQRYIIFNHVFRRTFCQLWTFTYWFEASHRTFLCLLSFSSNLCLRGLNLWRTGRFCLFRHFRHLKLVNFNLCWAGRFRRWAR